MPELAVAPTRRGEARRASILAAVEALLADRPLGAIGIREITEHAGVTRSGFYFYFASKQAAVAALIEQVTADVLALATDWIEDRVRPPRERVSTALHESLAVWRSHRTLVLAMLDAAATDEQIRTLNDQWMQAFMDAVAERIDEERAAGLARPGLPASQLASALICMNERSTERGLRAGEDDAAWAARVDTLVEVWHSTIYGGAA